jgi:flagellar protein FliS
MIKKISLYQEVELQSRVAGASPHRLVQLLYEAALVNLQLAQQLLQLTAPDGSQIALLERSLVKALHIVMELRDSLDFEVTSDLPHNLDSLYDYIQRRLLHARLKKDAAAVAECTSLLETLKSGWDAIGETTSE